MARNPLIAAAAAAVLSAGPAVAQEQLCQHRIDEVAGEFADMLDDPGYGSAQAVLRELRNAALRLQTQELEVACIEAVEAMQAAHDAYREAGPAQGAGIAPAPELGDLDERSVPFGEVEIDTSTIEGADVYNYDNDYLGEVAGVLLDAARPTHVIVGQGSFWDTGVGQAAIPAAMLRWDPEWDAFFVPITSEALEAAPDYAVATGQWSPKENDRYFDGLTD